MSNTYKKVKITLIIFALICFLSAFGFAYNDNNVIAHAAKEKNFTVAQTKKLYYNGKNYLAESEKKLLLSAFSFKFDDEEFSPNMENITIQSNYENAVIPGIYTIDILLVDGDIVYAADSVSFTISKCPVTVRVLLNGKTQETINESDLASLKINYDYSGAIHEDTKVELVNGIMVRSLKEGTYTTLAYTARLPQTPVENYTVVAGSGLSDFYEFSYEKSLLTILRVTVPELSYKNEQTVLVSLSGTFSNIYSLNFADIGVESSSTEFAAIKYEMEKEYDAAGELLSNNENIACYRVGIVDAYGKSISGIASNVRLFIPEKLRGKASYQIIALYDGGDTDVIKATLSDDGYLLFPVADEGVYVVTCPVEGISATTYITIIVIGVVVVFLVIFMFALFRRKY